MTASDASATRRIRVTVSDAWEVVTLDVSGGDTVAEVKRRALASARIPPAGAQGYEVKFGGALVADESGTLGDLGVPNGAGLVIVPRRRRPVR